MNKWSIVAGCVIAAGVVTLAFMPRDAPTFVDAKGRTWRYAPKGETVAAKFGTNIGGPGLNWYLIYDNGSFQEYPTKEAMYAHASIIPTGPQGPLVSA